MEGFKQQRQYLCSESGFILYGVQYRNLFFQRHYTATA
jgi:hypothetical protein